MNANDARSRLATAIERRVLQLDLTMREVAERSGMTEVTWRRIRKGTGTLTDRAKTRIERALDWTSGSVDAILAGGKPVEIVAEPVVATAVDGQSAILGGNPLTWTPHAICSTLLSYIPAGDEAFFDTLEAIAGMRRAALQREKRLT